MFLAPVAPAVSPSSLLKASRLCDAGRGGPFPDPACGAVQRRVQRLRRAVPEEKARAPPNSGAAFAAPLYSKGSPPQPTPPTHHPRQGLFPVTFLFSPLTSLVMSSTDPPPGPLHICPLPPPLPRSDALSDPGELLSPCPEIRPLLFASLSIPPHTQYANSPVDVKAFMQCVFDPQDRSHHTPPQPPLLLPLSLRARLEELPEELF